MHVMIVERDHRPAGPDRFLQPERVDAIEPWQIDDAETRPGRLFNLLRSMPRVREQPWPVAEDDRILAWTRDPSFACFNPGV